MPTLPTFDVTDAVASRILNAFRGQTNDQGQPITAVQAYRRWLRQSIVQHVAAHEASEGRSTLETDIGA